MIEAIAEKGAHRARVICDECGRDEVVACDYRNHPNHKSEPDVGQIHKKLNRHGWAIRRGKMHCPACAARRRALAHQEKEDRPDMVKTVVKEKPTCANSPSEEPPREPSYRMIGMICDMLNVAYDRAAKRYTNPADNDRTIAEAIGEGCMWGWVARIREAEYGPDMRWAEIDAIRSELADAVRELSARSDSASKATEARVEELLGMLSAENARIAAEMVSRIEALQKRVNALDPSIGPRAGKVSA